MRAPWIGFLALLALAGGCAAPAQEGPQAVRAYAYQNSLYDHQAAGGADADTRVPNWVARLAAAGRAGDSLAASGEFGFLAQWAAPPGFGVGYEDVPELPRPADGWAGLEDVNLVVFVPDNFDSQDIPPDERHADPGRITEVESYAEALSRLIAAWEANAPPATPRRYRVYAGPKTFYPYADPIGSADAADVRAWEAEALGPYQAWHEDLVGLLAAAHPTLDIGLIDVNEVAIRTRRDTALASLPVTRLFEDPAPHGTETWYLLAGLVTYMEVFGRKPPADYRPPSGAGVDPVMTDNWAAIVDHAWGLLHPG
jgi:hypothetical protein